MQNLCLPLCPKCGDTKFVNLYFEHNKLAQSYACSKCCIYWSTDLGILDFPKSNDGSLKDKNEFAKSV